jgi:hypothetical protein
VNVLKRISATDPVPLEQFHMKGGLDRNVECFAFESQLRRIGTYLEVSWLEGVATRLDFIDPVGIT